MKNVKLSILMCFLIFLSGQTLASESDKLDQNLEELNKILLEDAEVNDASKEDSIIEAKKEKVVVEKQSNKRNISSVENHDIEAVKKEIKEYLSEFFPQGLEIKDVQFSGAKGIYFFRANNQGLMFVEGGRYILNGDLIDMHTEKNVLESYMASYYKETLDSYDESDFIVFEPENREAKYEVIVFTDPTCGYCQKMHSEMNQYLSYGIKIKYLPYPRGGLSGQGYDALVSSWCSVDSELSRQELLTKAKESIYSPEILNNKIDEVCKENVNEMIVKTQNLKVTGTPAVFTEEAVQIGGYLPAQVLLQRITPDEQ